VLLLNASLLLFLLLFRYRLSPETFGYTLVPSLSLSVQSDICRYICEIRSVLVIYGHRDQRGKQNRNKTTHLHFRLQLTAYKRKVIKRKE
jgi:hypothetical protein